MADSSHTHRSSLKQQNKPFKARGKTQPRKKSSGKTTVAPMALPTSAMDWVGLNKQDRANYQNQRRQKHREDLTMKRRGLRTSKPGTMEVDSVHGPPPKIVGFFGTNEGSDAAVAAAAVQSQCGAREDGAWEMPDWAEKGLGVKAWVLQRDIVPLLDVCKVADVLVLVMNCQHIDPSAIKLSPEVNSPFDQLTYTCLTALRAQGLPTVVGWLQGLTSIPPKKQKDVKKLIKRFFESEISAGKFVIETDLQKAIRTIAQVAVTAEDMIWRQSRAYMLAHAVQYSEETKELAVSGYIRGSGYLNANQLVHITGYGDFQLRCIEADGQLFEAGEGAETLQTENDPGPFCAEQTWPQEDELVSAMDSLKIIKTDHEALKFIESDEESEEESIQMEENVKQVKLTQRPQEDLDFPDEVDTPADKPARVRFQRYRGLKSFRTSPWDPYESLPKEYSKLYEFKENVSAVRSAALEHAKASSQVSINQFCTVHLKNVPAIVKEHPATLPLILSSLLQFERKLTVMQYKVVRTGGDDQVTMESKEAVAVHSGFRRFTCRPIYSEDSLNENKSKYLKSVTDTAIASLYAPVLFPPANVLIFKSTSEH